MNSERRLTVWAVEEWQPPLIDPIAYGGTRIAYLW
jgi:hypothetical protein